MIMRVKKIIIACACMAACGVHHVGAIPMLSTVTGFLGRQLSVSRYSTGVPVFRLPTNRDLFPAALCAPGITVAQQTDWLLKNNATLAKKVLIQGIGMQLAWSYALGLNKCIDSRELNYKKFVEAADVLSKHVYHMPIAHLMELGQQQRREARRINVMNETVNTWMRDSAGYM